MDHPLRLRIELISLTEIRSNTDGTHEEKSLGDALIKKPDVVSCVSDRIRQRRNPGSNCSVIRKTPSNCTDLILRRRTLITEDHHVSDDSKNGLVDALVVQSQGSKQHLGCGRDDRWRCRYLSRPTSIGRRTSRERTTLEASSHVARSRAPRSVDL